MTDVLVALAGAGLVVVGGIVAAGLVVRWRLRRANRLHPKVATPAPVTWLVAPTTPARLHRRLQATVRVASLPAGNGPPAAVVDRVVELDHRLVLAARLPTGRRGRELRALAGAVDELDRLALAVTRPLEPPVTGEPVEALRLLAAARDEVEAIDRRHHLPA